MSRLGNILLPLRAAVSTNLALGLHFEDADDSYIFNEVTGKVASVSHSARIYNPSNGYRLVADFPFSNATQLTDQTGRHTLGTFSGTSPASGQDYIYFDPTLSQMGEFSPGGAYQGDYDATEDYKVTFDVAIKAGTSSFAVLITTGNNYSLTTSYLTLNVNINTTTKKWRLNLQHGGSSSVGVVDHDCDLNAISSVYTTFYTVTIAVNGAVATASTSLETVTSTMPDNLWRHYITTKGPTLAARVNTVSSGVPAYTYYAKCAIKNYKQHVRDQWPASIPSNGSFGKYALFTGGDLTKYDGHSDFTLNSSSNWTMHVRVLIPSGPTDGNSTFIPIYIGDIASTTLGTRAYLRITPSSSSLSAVFFGTNSSTGVGGGTTTTVRDTWHDILVARNGATNQTRVYINGTQVGSTNNVYIDLITPPVYLGGGRNATGTLTTYQGWALVDELYFRLSCEQTGSSYTLPTTPFADS